MKRSIALLLLTVLTAMVLTLSAAGQQTEPIQYDYEHMTVAGVTPTTGNFFCSLWGNVTSDMDVRLLLHGYNLVEWDTADSLFRIDETVVSGIIVTEDAVGNRTYTIALYNDLYYSDGTRITAADYAFSMLLTMAPEMSAIGGNVKRPEYLMGYRDYITGAVPYLAGVRILAEDQFSITVSADYLPFFYELGLLDCNPYPISVIAPGVRVADDGNGIYLTNIDEGEPVFTAELLRSTILDPQTGYLTHPTVTSGPYRLVSYDGNRAEFELNERYKGDAHGFKPSIQHLTYMTLKAEEMVPAFRDGTVTLLNKVASADTILDGTVAVSANNQLNMTTYPRTGLAFISFSTEHPVVSEAEVRQALAYAMDRDAFLESVTGNYGVRTDGYYGVGQWMYQLLTGAINYPIADDEDPEEVQKELGSLTMEKITVYDYDIEAAMDLLGKAGWNLSADGGVYLASEGGVRYKQIGGSLVPLRLTLAYPQGSSAAAGLFALAETVKDAGIELVISELPLNELLAQYYGNTERTYDMFFLASNFDALFDPSADFVVNDAGRHVWKQTGLADDELYQYAVEMRKTESGDLLTYLRHWIDFQERFAEVVPMIPLYSNVYFDFYPKVLHDYNIASNLAWTQAVIPAYMSDVEETTETPESEEEGDLELFIIE